MNEYRRVLGERGNERLRAFFETASESGMRKGELCRLRREEIEIDSRTLKVSLPNKSNRERVAFFSDRASLAIREWLAVRNTNCTHDFLFHNLHGDPLSGKSISNEFKKTLCKMYEGNIANETGFDTFEIHKLRHTFASELANGGADANTLMTCLGHVCAKSVDGYTKLADHTTKVGFSIAMEKVERGTPEGLGKRVLTTEEFLLLMGETASLLI
jgi:integrase